MTMTEQEKKDLIRQAKAHISNSYAPYSHFHVSAALLCTDGTVYIGNNVENSSYSATNCAERTAFFTAVSAGVRSFQAIAVCGGMNGEMTDYCPPCGVCRQVMREFCNPSEFLILLAKSEDDYKEYTLAELLPESFGPDHLN